MRSGQIQAVLAILIIGVFLHASITSPDSGLSLTDLFAQTLLRFQAGVVPSDSGFFHQWGLAKIQAPEAWEISQGASGTIIAILDSGIDQDHPDLQDKIVACADFTTSANLDDHLGHGSPGIREHDGPLRGALHGTMV